MGSDLKMMLERIHRKTRILWQTKKYLFLCLDGVPWGVLVEIQDPMLLLLLLLFVLFEPVELFRGVFGCKLYWLLFN